MKRIIYFFCFFMAFSAFLKAQENATFLEKLKSYGIQPSVGIQLWGTYTHGQEFYNELNGTYEAVDDRLNFQIRRIRVGLKGQPYKRIKFNITTAVDFVGRDLLSATQGGANNGTLPSFDVWHAYLQTQLLKDKDILHMTVGYITPQIGRESITGAFGSTSMEKSWSQNYLRRHLTGKGPGRSMGINLGGLFFKEEASINFSYDVGLFNPVQPSLGGNSTGIKSSPLLVGRLVLQLGDPESKKYTLGHKVNYFNQRKGISLGLAGATQGATDLFDLNQAFGFDVLINWGGFNLDGDWTWLRRMVLDGNGREIVSMPTTGYARLSYNFPLSGGRHLEPMVMWTALNGALDQNGLFDAVATNSFAGKDHLIDVGINYYLNTRFKLALHYSFHQADEGAAGPGNTINNYFVQGGVGAIRRGDWIGLGLSAAF